MRHVASNRSMLRRRALRRPVCVCERSLTQSRCRWTISRPSSPKRQCRRQSCRVKCNGRTEPDRAGPGHARPASVGVSTVADARFIFPAAAAAAALEASYFRAAGAPRRTRHPSSGGSGRQRGGLDGTIRPVERRAGVVDNSPPLPSSRSSPPGAPLDSCICQAVESAISVRYFLHLSLGDREELTLDRQCNWSDWAPLSDAAHVVIWWSPQRRHSRWKLSQELKGE